MGGMFICKSNAVSAAKLYLIVSAWARISARNGTSAAFDWEKLLTNRASGVGQRSPAAVSR